MLPPRLRSIDHLVLNVADLEQSCAFYTQALGARIVRFGDNRLAIQIGAQKINLHPAQSAHAPLAKHPTAGSADLCFLSDNALSEWRSHLQACDVAIVLGPTQRSGACGPILSLYIYDPDGNLIEIANQLRLDAHPQSDNPI